MFTYYKYRPLLVFLYYACYVLGVRTVSSSVHVNTCMLLFTCTLLLTVRTLYMYTRMLLLTVRTLYMYTYATTYSTHTQDIGVHTVTSSMHVYMYVHVNTCMLLLTLRTPRT